MADAIRTFHQRPDPGSIYDFYSITSGIDDFICNGASIGLNSAPSGKPSRSGRLGYRRLGSNLGGAF
jgi:hypothetical protein